MTTLYEKVGKRYRPVREERYWDSWPDGFHLVYADPEGGRSFRFNINPDTAAMQAAAKAREANLRKVLNDALAMRPAQRPVTELQAVAWEAFKTAMGNDRYIVEYESVNGIIDRMIEELLS
jgi:hypothetical protein